jgi:hypothetical protein
VLLVQEQLIDRITTFAQLYADKAITADVFATHVHQLLYAHQQREKPAAQSATVRP